MDWEDFLTKFGWAAIAAAVITAIPSAAVAYSTIQKNNLDIQKTNLEMKLAQEKADREAAAEQRAIEDRGNERAEAIAEAVAAERERWATKVQDAEKAKAEAEAKAAKFRVAVEKASVLGEKTNDTIREFCENLKQLP